MQERKLLAIGEPTHLAGTGRLLRRLRLGLDHVIVLALVVLPLLLFAAEAVGQRVFFYHDLQYYFFPYHKLVADVIRSGNLPLWNPYAFGGIPLLGDGQTAIFYPPNWLFLLLPTALALNLAILLEFSIAGVGMWLFARCLGLRRAAALLAALSYMWSGFLTTRVVHLSIMSGTALIPLLFWGYERLLTRPTPRRFAVAGLCVAVQAVSGHPQVPVYTAFALAIYGFVRSVIGYRQQRSPGSFLDLVYLGGMYVLGYAVAAIQIVPWFGFAALSPRAAGAAFEFVTLQSIGGSDWLLWLFPYGKGGVAPGLWEHGAIDISRAVGIWERTPYVGIAPLMLVIVALVGRWKGTAPETSARQERSRWALCAVLVAGLLVATGYHTPAGHIVYALPVMGKLRAYSRAVVLASFAVCALAAFGLHRLLEASAEDWRTLRSAARGAVLLVVGVIVGVLILAQRPGLLPALAPSQDYRAHLTLSQPNGAVPLILALSVGVGILLVRRPRGFTILLLLAGADMVLFAIDFNPTASARVFRGIPGSVQFLRHDPDQYRVAPFINNDMLAPPIAEDQLALSWSMVYGISSINGFNSLQPRRYTDLLWGPDVGDVSYGFMDDDALVQPNNYLLRLLGVKYVLVQHSSNVHPGQDFELVYDDPAVMIYRLRKPWDLAWFADQVAPMPAAEILQKLRKNEIDPRNTALVEDMDRTTAARLVHAPSGGTVTISRPNPNTLDITATTEYRRLLVVSEPWFAGWEATLDGRPVHVYRTDYVLRGIDVPPGTHTIQFRYVPSILLGTVLTLAALLLAGVLFLWNDFGRRRVSTRDRPAAS